MRCHTTGLRGKSGRLSTSAAPDVGAPEAAPTNLGLAGGGTMKRTRAARIEKRRAQVFPLDQFPPDRQAEIARLVAAPKPPPKWLALGPPDSPRPLAWIISRAWVEWHWHRGIDPDGRRDPLPKGRREAVIARDGYVCGICRGAVEPDDVHIDHIKPWSKGGTHALSNLQVAHSVCNMRKGARG